MTAQAQWTQMGTPRPSQDVELEALTRRLLGEALRRSGSDSPTPKFNCDGRWSCGNR
jgi:hypothetical protein